MKIFIAFLALMAITIDAQLEPDPFTSFISNYYNRRQDPQINYQSYVPYQPSITNRRRPYTPSVTTSAPTTFVPYRSSSISPQYYNPYLTSTTTLRPYNDISTTQIPTIVLPYSTPLVVSRSYRPLQSLTGTRRPYLVRVTTPSPTTVPSYSSTNIALESNILSTENNLQYVTAQTNSGPTKISLYNAQTLAPKFNRPYQTTSTTTTSRPYVPIVTTQAPTRVPIYKAPTLTPQYYRPSQTFSTTTTSRPYVPIVTTPAPTRKPIYNTPNLNSQYYKPYQISTTTRRPYFSVVTTPTPATVPLYNTPSHKLNLISATTLRPFIPTASSTLQPYVPPPYVSPSTVYLNGEDRLANTRRSGSEINTDGSYNWFFETDNGIAAQAQGTPKNFGGDPPFVGEDVKGAFSWTAPNGEFIDFTYTADENGYHPQGNAIPTPPPLPPHVVRLLEYLSSVAGAKK